MSITAPAASPAVPDGRRRARLPARELLGTTLQGLRTRRLRAALSALGIAIGIGAMVAVVGVSSSARANLLAEIDSLGTNLLTITPGQSFTGQSEVLPATSIAQIARQPNVLSDVAIYRLTNEDVYRNPYVPAAQTGGLAVDAAGHDLPQVLGTSMATGHFLDQVSDRYPEAVLGAQAAQVLPNHPTQQAHPHLCRQHLVSDHRRSEARGPRLGPRLGRTHLLTRARAPLPTAPEPVRRSTSAPTRTT